MRLRLASAQVVGDHASVMADTAAHTTSTVFRLPKRAVTAAVQAPRSLVQLLTGNGNGSGSSESSKRCGPGHAGFVHLPELPCIERGHHPCVCTELVSPSLFQPFMPPPVISPPPVMSLPSVPQQVEEAPGQERG